MCIRSLLAVGLVSISVAAIATFSSPSDVTLANGVPLSKGGVIAGTGNGTFNHFTTAGAKIDTLNDTTGSVYTTGGCFDSAGNFYGTNFATGGVSEFDTGGNLGKAVFAGGMTNPESCTFDKVGNLWVGDAATNVIRKFSSTGTLLQSFSVATEDRGTDWLDLAADQCTMLYTSEGPSILSFNVCGTSKQNAAFESGLSAPCYANRIRPNGEVLVACSSNAYRLSSSGAILRTYTGIGAGHLFSLNLDPDNTTFWTGDFGNGVIYHVDIATGTVIGTPFSSQALSGLFGVAVVGEINVAIVQDFKQNVTTNPTSDGGTGGPWSVKPTAGDNSRYLAGDPSCDSIHAGGCALSSVADVAYSYGVQTLKLNGAQVPLDPGSLNNLVAANPKYQYAKNPCYTNFAALATALNLQVISSKYGAPVVINGVSQIPPSAIQAALKDKNLPIIHVDTSDKNNPDGHWVVVYKDAGNNDFLIANPWFGRNTLPNTKPPVVVNELSGMLLSQAYPGYPVTQMIVYQATPNPNFKAWSLRAHSPVQFIVTDPSGRQTGYVASSGNLLQNIPGASYVIGNGINDPEGIEPPLPNIPDFENDTPVDGTYIVQVVGTGTGPYTLDFFSSTDTGTSTTTTLSGTAAQGSLDTYRVTIGGTAGGTIQLADNIPPTTAATVTSGTAGTNGWYTSNVQVALTATDNPGGSGAKQIVYSATGAQPIASTTIASASAVIPVTADGQTILTFAATDNAGNAETPKSVTVKVDKTPASCALTAVIAGPPKQLQITVQDTGSGLSSIVPTEVTNATVSIPASTVGTTSPVVVTATKTDQTMGASVTLQATDVAGNATTCDPAMVTVTGRAGKPVSKVVTGVAQAESTVSIYNSTPGLKQLNVMVNGKLFKVTRLHDGEVRTIDVAAGLTAGNHNTIVLTPHGSSGSADVLITDMGKHTAAQHGTKHQVTDREEQQEDTSPLD
jgi:hypothetical protein